MGNGKEAHDQMTSQGHGYNETAAEKRDMREQIAKANFGVLPYLDTAPAGAFFEALLGCTFDGVDL